jgi:putative ABC transport system permease protein
VVTLTLSRLANASSQAGIALGGVLSSFSLMVAMAIMVASFRVSLDDWLLHILPADIYVGTGGGATAGLRPQEQAAWPPCPAWIMRISCAPQPVAGAQGPKSR